MHVDTLEIGPFSSNCHIIRNEMGQALVVDPGAEAERIIQHLRHHHLNVVAYLLTHGHMDHVSALAEVHRAFPAPVALHPKDATWAFSPSNQMPPYYGIPEAPPEVERTLADGQTWEDIGLTYRTLWTPGHAPGHIVFYFEAQGVLIAGDLLFRGSVGRIDLPGGNRMDMQASLQKVMTLPDQTVVYPGHGPVTTIGDERRTNPFLAPDAFD